MNAKPDRNLIFMGMMGAGKTTVGKECSRILAMDFFDADEVYEKEFGSIANTFRIEGESVFRMRESGILEELCRLRGVVISVGGGAVLSDKFKTLASTGTVVWLRAAAETLSMRLNAHSALRPLNKGAESLSQILSAREALYKKYADIVIDTDNMPISAVIENCLNKNL